MFVFPGIALNRGLIYLAAAVVPALVLMIYIYNHNEVQYETSRESDSAYR